MARLILASASPRRKELLAQAGYKFEVRAADVNEDVRAGEDPIAYVVRLAREKAQAVFRELSALEGTGNREQGIGAATSGGLVVLGADTTVTLDGHILGKPQDAADAARMLRMLSGRTHRVMTGVAVVTSKRVEVASEVTGVRFLTLSDAEIAAYVSSGEPMDKAGAYGIQGLAAKWIPRVEGDYFNVVGLPLALVSTMLEMAVSDSALSPSIIGLTAIEREIVIRCMKATDFYIDDVEKHTRLGVEPRELRRIIAAWPNLNESSKDSEEFLAINNCMNEVCHGFSIAPDDWSSWFEVPMQDVVAIYKKWLSMRGLRGGLR